MDVPYWFFDTQTIGGVIVLTALGTALIIYVFMLLWIYRGAQEDEE